MLCTPEPRATGWYFIFPLNAPSTLQPTNCDDQLVPPWWSRMFTAPNGNKSRSVSLQPFCALTAVLGTPASNFARSDCMLWKADFPAHYFFRNQKCPRLHRQQHTLHGHEYIRFYRFVRLRLWLICCFRAFQRNTLLLSEQGQNDHLLLRQVISTNCLFVSESSRASFESSFPVWCRRASHSKAPCTGQSTLLKR